MLYLSVGDLLNINRELTDSEPEVLDQDALEAAVARPQSILLNQHAYPTLEEKAAALLHALLEKAPFSKQNVCTAIVAAIIFLNDNGLRENWTPEKAEGLVKAIQSGAYDIPHTRHWLIEHTEAMA